MASEMIRRSTVVKALDLADRIHTVLASRDGSSAQNYQNGYMDGFGAALESIRRDLKIERENTVEGKS